MPASRPGWLFAPGKLSYRERGERLGDEDTARPQSAGSASLCSRPVHSTSPQGGLVVSILSVISASRR